MKSVIWPKPGYASITCSTTSNIPYNLIFTTKFNDFSILITIISCDYLNLSLAINTLVTSQYQSRLSSITNIFSRRISHSDWNIQIKLNYSSMNLNRYPGDWSIDFIIYVCFTEYSKYTTNPWNEKQWMFRIWRVPLSLRLATHNDK